MYEMFYVITCDSIALSYKIITIKFTNKIFIYVILYIITTLAHYTLLQHTQNTLILIKSFYYHPRFKFSVKNTTGVDGKKDIGPIGN